MSDLVRLKKLLEPHMKDITTMSTDDAMLSRFIVGSTSVQEAYERLLATEKFRREWPITDLNIDSKGVRKIVNMKVCVLLDEKDKDGRPVAYIAVRNHSMKDRSLEEFKNFMFYMLELATSKCSKDLENLCIIFDMRDFSLSVMDYQVIKQLFDVMQMHYPERMGVTLVLNSPLIFKACWTIIRPWLDEHTCSKIKFVTDAEAANYIDPKIIPDI